MINLLPPQLKQDYSYAKRNARLLKWVVSIGFGILGLVVITAAGILYLQQSASQYTKQAQQIDSNLNAGNQAKLDKEVKDISSNLKLAVQVLSKEVLFSKLLKQLAVIVPAQATLSNLSIMDLQSGVDISAKTTDYQAATQLLVNLTDPKNQIFAKADISSINCASSAQKVKYPCTVVIRAVFSQDNPFLFINNKLYKQ